MAQSENIYSTCLNDVVIFHKDTVGNDFQVAFYFIQRLKVLMQV